MRLLLLPVGLALVCGLQAQDESPAEPQQSLEELSGTWHTAALASNNSALIAPDGPFRVFVNTMSAKDGNLHGEILVPQEGRCDKVSLTAFKTDTNKFHLQFWGHNDLYLDEARPKDYVILHMINQHDGVTSLVVHLMVRDPGTQQDSLQAFQAVCEDLGLREDQTVVLDTDDRCQSFRD